MSIDMQKQAASVSLEKAMKVSMDKGNDPGEIGARVIGFVDFSGSMSERFKGRKKMRGNVPSEMEVTVTRDLGMALTGLDSDQNIPLYAFDDRFIELGEITEENHKNFIAEAVTKHRLGFGTRYLPMVEAINQKYNPQPGDAEPVVAIVHTDGMSSDIAEFKAQVVADSGRPIFWIFIGHGLSLQFLRDLDTMGGREVDNVALVELKDASDLTDEQYYDQLVREFIVDWYPAARAKGIVR